MICIYCDTQNNWTTTGPGLTGTGIRNCSEHGSDRCETLPKHVSDDPRQVNSRPKKLLSRKIFGVGQHFLPFWVNFGGRTRKWTSKSKSSQYFALDALIMRPVRPKIDENVFVSAVKTLGGYQCMRVPVWGDAVRSQNFQTSNNL